MAPYCSPLKTSRNRTLTSKHLQSADGTLVYAECLDPASPNSDSSKPSLVFIHGFSLSTIVWDGVFDDEPGSFGKTSWDEFKLVRYDTRGHGRSGKPTCPAAWESKRLAEDFDAVVEGFGLVKPFVICWSLGGTHLTDILSFNPPTYLSGAILISAFPTIPSLPQLCTPLAFTIMPAFQGLDCVKTFQDTAVAFVKSMIYSGTDNLTESDSSPLSTPSTSSSVSGTFSDASSSPTTSSPTTSLASSLYLPSPLPHHFELSLLGLVLLQPRACAIQLFSRTQDDKGFWEAGRGKGKKGRGALPMLVIEGEEDLLVKTGAVERLLKGSGDEGNQQGSGDDGGHKEWKRLEVVTFPRTGHMPFWERKEEVRDLVIAFVERIWKEKRPNYKM